MPIREVTDLDQLRRLHTRLTEHQMLALSVIDAGDDLVAALRADGIDTTSLVEEYTRRRTEFERIVTAPPHD